MFSGGRRGTLATNGLILGKPNIRGVNDLCRYKDFLSINSDVQYFSIEVIFMNKPDQGGHS